MEQHCVHDGSPGALTLRYRHGGWWVWRTSHWVEVENRAVRALLYAFTLDARFLTANGPASWAPTRHKISDLLEALGAIIILSNEIEQPCWIDGRSDGVLVSVANGLLDITSRNLHAHTPLYFNQTSVPFDYDAAAPEPRKWLAFLAVAAGDCCYRCARRVVWLRDLGAARPSQDPADGWPDPKALLHAC